MSTLLHAMLVLWTCSNAHKIFYDTDHSALDCLHYFSTELYYFTEIVKYCVRPVIETDWNVSDPYFTFAELAHLNVTSHEVLVRSRSIDLAEQYQYYLDQLVQSNLSNEGFFNCTLPWFGSRCQYTFELTEGEVVWPTLEIAHEYRGTCYILLECDRGGSSMCLDWREVCNGRIDCLNDGVDELHCFNLELNECNENEYRCHNGLCIPKIFLNMDSVEAQCLDRSDRLANSTCVNFYFQTNLFECEEFVCRPNEGQFVCGDGHCVDDFDQCQSGRHLALTKSIAAKGDLSYDCWQIMLCLSKMTSHSENVSCEEFLQSNRTIEKLKNCTFPMEFPVIPVLFGHVRFLYYPREIDGINLRSMWRPDYVCYDQQLCDFLLPSLRHKTLTCRNAEQMGLASNNEWTTWKSMIDAVKPYFVGCLVHRYRETQSHYPSLYRCQNSSKYISTHRIVDGRVDCFLQDDEQAFELSCALNQTFRFRCPNEQQCRSPLFRGEFCPLPAQFNPDEICFYRLCDRIPDIPSLLLTDGRHHSDETDCEQWPCNNVYTRCNGFRNCLTAEDEENCMEAVSSDHFLSCITTQNDTVVCLPADQQIGGMVDCFVASPDEFEYPGVSHRVFQPYRFRCWNNTRCTEDQDLCSETDDCPMHDNEEFCANHPQLCHDHDFDDGGDSRYIRCHIVETRYISFSLETTALYPLLASSRITSVANLTDEENTTSEQCRSGLLVYHRLMSDNYTGLCFCPLDYYGDRCQYQSQRVSLTLSLAAVYQPIVYAIVATLVEDDDDREEIQSYHQFTYVSYERCGRPVNIYLLYANRAKNHSKNYSIRVDAFDKTSMTYLLTWYLRISFLFLPVNRLTAFLTLPSSRTPNPKYYCSRRCLKGTCMKYHNEERFFCQCYSSWTGAQCHIPIDCSTCAPNSLCIGSIRNRSICVCPHDKFGSRCRLQLTCPPDYCQNNGRCVVMDERMIEQSYVCFCVEPFFGERCEFVQHRVDIALDQLQTPLYLLAYVYDELSFEQSTPSFVLLRRMTMFQESVTLYLEATFQMILVKTNTDYYLAALQSHPSSNISTSISANERCPPIEELFDREFLSLPRIRRLKNYHLPCQRDFALRCFIDELYMCLCTIEQHANCFPFHQQLTYACEDNVYCENGGTCLQDQPMCFFSILCVCNDCFFGDRCQFYAKGIGLTLDDLLRYSIRPNRSLTQQAWIVTLSAVFVMIVLVVGLLNSFFSYLVFRQRNCRRVGSGIYLRLSSVISPLVVSTLAIKFWFITYTYMNPSVHRRVLRAGCLMLEPALCFFLHMSSWLNTCVAIERAITVLRGINFNKRKSRRIARWTLRFLPVAILSSMSYESVHRDLFDDYEERRVWCVVRYSPSVETYTTIVQYFHFVAPFTVNLFSALFIIVNIARQRATIRTRLSYRQQLLTQFNEHKQLVISPVLLAVLLLPRFLISLLSGCVKASRDPWLYLLGYFISFIPSTFVFIIFVLPSSFYQRHFKESITHWRERLSRE